MSLPSTVVWGMMAVCDVLTAGDPKGCPSPEPSKENMRGLQGISSPVALCAAEATAPFLVCSSGQELREGRGEADGRWWEVVCFN